MNEENSQKQSVCRDIFKALHEGKWLSIEYRNKSEQITKYWIGINDVNPVSRTLDIDGLHLFHHTVASFSIKIDGIVSSCIVDGTYHEINKALVNDISINPEKYESIFQNVVNLKILNYLEECNKMDTIPYKSDYSLIQHLDGEILQTEFYSLNGQQFKEIVDHFQIKTKRTHEMKIQRLAMNVLSVHTAKGLYVLAYRDMNLDVKHKVLRPAESITICTEFTIDGKKESIRKFLDAEAYSLLKGFEKNAEKIKDAIQKRGNTVDDMPYFIAIGMDIVPDLRKEYKAITEMHYDSHVTYPIKAFFGNLVSRPNRKKVFPLMLMNNKINVDQLLAIHNGMKYPLAYIQGPPGTGKTNTIINTITTAFFNGKTVLFTSYNNHPIDGVFEKLTRLQYRDKTIPFPILRLGSNEVMKETLVYLRKIISQTESISVFEKTLDRNRDDRMERSKKLSEILMKYEELLSLKEREETIRTVQAYSEAANAVSLDISFEISLTNQAHRLEQYMKKLGTIKESEVLELLEGQDEELFKYLYFISAKHIKKIHQQCKELLDILKLEKEEEAVAQFNKYLSESENVKKLLKVFPIIATTCISAHKIGSPETYFDMVIMDEASQCNTAVALVPIIRGESLMLVGDPQQLNPVILLDEMTNLQLRKKYFVADEYDYCTNSIYKTFLACDAVSDEILLRNHYRCHKDIIEFNNKKYYNSKLKIETVSQEKQPLVFVDVGEVENVEKNTSDIEVEKIIQYCSLNKDKSIGIITPFVNQRKKIEAGLKVNALTNISCGTVHAFQGDEKDVILFSTAITNHTALGTYEWLKNNKELINVATSRAKDKLIILSSMKNIERLHSRGSEDDFYELVQYTRTNGKTEVSQKEVRSRALGVKPYSTAIEEAFLENLRHALGNILISQNKYSIEKEVPISQVFDESVIHPNLFYTGRFDFVVYEMRGKQKWPVLAIELDGKEHFTEEVVKARDQKKNEICRLHGMELIRVENSYARRYNYIKDVLKAYFAGK